MEPVVSYRLRGGRWVLVVEHDDYTEILPIAPDVEAVLDEETEDLRDLVAIAEYVANRKGIQA